TLPISGRPTRSPLLPYTPPFRSYYQVTYETGASQDGSGYLHAQWNRSNPLQTGVTHPILSGVQGQGQYVGTYIAWGVNSSGWWGEGEVKFYLDGDCAEATAGAQD